MHFVPHLELSLAYLAAWRGRQHTRQSLVGLNERILRLLSHCNDVQGRHFLLDGLFSDCLRLQKCLLQIKELFALLGTKNIELRSQVFDFFLQTLNEFVGIFRLLIKFLQELATKLCFVILRLL